MSSQGPGNTTPGNGVPFAIGPVKGSPETSPGYRFTSAAIRDGSDWIAYKKQTLLYKTRGQSISSNPWMAYGNAHRLDLLSGQSKCLSCEGSAFDGFTDIPLITIDFVNRVDVTENGNVSYVEYTIPADTTILRFQFVNLPGIDAQYPEINSHTFDFISDGSTLLLNGESIDVSSSTSFSLTYGITNNDNQMHNGDVLTLRTTAAISGVLRVGYNND